MRWRIPDVEEESGSEASQQFLLCEKTAQLLGASTPSEQRDAPGDEQEDSMIPHNTFLTSTEDDTTGSSHNVRSNVVLGHSFSRKLNKGRA
jgi:hypothetical protein